LIAAREGTDVVGSGQPQAWDADDQTAHAARACWLHQAAPPLPEL